MALRAPERLADTIRGTDVLIVLSGHTHRASAAALAGVPVWVSSASASVTDRLFRHGFRGHSGGGFTCVDLLDHGEIATTYVPLTGRDDVFYEIVLDDLTPQGTRYPPFLQHGFGGHRHNQRSLPAKCLLAGQRPARDGNGVSRRP